jgi:calcium-dependent protein kinase
MGQCSCSPKMTGLFIGKKKFPDTSMLTLNMEASTSETLKRKFCIDFAQENIKKINQNYFMTQNLLGRGSFGEVREAKHLPTNQMRAVKIIVKKRFSLQLRKKLMKEITILKSLDHPNIVKIYEYFQDNECIYIVMELVKGKELFQYIVENPSVTEETAAVIFRQLLSAISYLHATEIVHRDIKPENIIFDGKIVKLIDFGTSKKFKALKMMTKYHGSTYYIAPEVIKKSYYKECDIWSCGIVLYILLSGTPPFNGETDDEIIRKITRGSFSFNIPEFNRISPDAKDLISSMLRKCPSSRISLKSAFHHSWFSKYLPKQFTNPDLNLMLNLKSFNIKTELQHALFYYMINCVVTPNQRNEIMKTFQTLDQDFDGILTKEDLYKGFRDCRIEATEEELDRIVFCMDYHQNNRIDFSEFVGAVINKKEFLIDENILMCFKNLDSDRDGVLSVNDFQMILKDHQLIDAKYWSKMVHQFSADEEIQYQDFEKILKSIIIY